MKDEKSITGTLLFKNTLLNIAGISLPLFIGLLAVRFTLRGLGEQAFGILSLLWVFLSNFALLDFGLSRAATKFAAEAIHQADKAKLSRLASTGLISSFFLGGLGGIILALITPVLTVHLLTIPPDLIPATKKAFLFIAMGLPVLLATINIKGMLSAAQRFDLVNAVQIPMNSLGFLIPALSLFLKLDISQIILFIMVTRLAGCIAYLVICRRVLLAGRGFGPLDGKALKQLLSYGGWVTVSGIISPLLVYLDRFLVGSLLSITLLTYYTIPIETITRLRIFPTALMTTLFPEFSKPDQTGRPEYHAVLFSKSLRFTLLAMGFLGISLHLFSSEILTLWIGKDTALVSSPLFRILALTAIFNFAALVPFTYLQGIGRPDLPAKFHLGEIVFYPILLWIGLTRAGLTGAALVWSVRVIADAILLFSAAFTVEPSLIRTLKRDGILPILAGLLLLALAAFLTGRLAEGALQKGIIWLAVTALYLTLVWRRMLGEEDRRMLLTFFSRRRLGHA